MLVCPTSASVTTVHCVLHRQPQHLELLLAVSPSAPGHEIQFCVPPAGNHTIAINACAFQSVHSTHRQSTAAISACMSNIRVSNRISLCDPLAGHLLCNHCLCFLVISILIAFGSRAYQSVPSAHWQSTPLQSVRVSNICVKTHSPMCVPPAVHLRCNHC